MKQPVARVEQCPYPWAKKPKTAPAATKRHLYEMGSPTLSRSSVSSLRANKIVRAKHPRDPAHRSQFGAGKTENLKGLLRNFKGPRRVQKAEPSLALSVRPEQERTSFNKRKQFIRQRQKRAILRLAQPCSNFV